MKQMEEHLAGLSNCSTDSFFDESDCDVIPSSKLIKWRIQSMDFLSLT